ncbi:MAG: PAS domain-containing protein [Anaerolineales bacterium]|nr:PAS domain-containing protein [Anaerolineales bacterium]
MTLENENPALENLLEYLRQSRGFDFTGYKRNSLQRRIQKRMAMVSINDYSDYVDYLEVHPDEFELLFNTILINVTAFFRDKPAWDYLQNEIIPRIIHAKKTNETVRVWSAGCASGEEAYSMAILLAEALGENDFRNRVKIYATDVDEEALAEARHARYSAENLKAIDPVLRDKYFYETPEGTIFRSDLRRQLIFGRHDLVQDAPISRLDLLVCRNTLMYMNADTQSEILQRMHFALREDGYLFLGKAEMMLTRTNLFLPTDLTYRVFSKVPRIFDRNHLYAPPQPREEKLDSTLEIQRTLWEGALNAIDLAALVIDRHGTLVMANNALRVMFDLDARDIGRPLQDFEISYRPVELRSLIDRVYETQKTEIVENVKRALKGGEFQFLDVKVVLLPEGDPNPVGVGITFTDVTRFQHMQNDLERANQELETTNEELQSSNEELETTNEELQSTNEELETTNEVLQSTNEELETMNEELQSTNEELETLNTELRRYSSEITDTNALLNAILASNESGVVVVNPHIDILLWNEAATELWGLRSDEVQGNSFLALDIGLPVEKLSKPIRACLNGKMAREVVAIEAINRRGRSFHCQVSISPLVVAQDEIIGVILLMTE